MSNSSAKNLKNTLSNLTLAAKALEVKIEQADSSTRANLKNALDGLNATIKRLEFEIKQAEAPPDKIGQILVSRNIITANDLNEAMKRKRKEPTKYLGQILCEMGLPQSKIMHWIYYSNKRKQIGQILVELNIITEAQLRECLLQQKDLKQQGIFAPLGSVMIKNRMISEESFMIALSAHFSMPIISLKGHTLSPAMQKVVGEKYAFRHRIVVLSDDSDHVKVALAEPHLEIIGYLEKAMPRGKHIMFYLARESEIEDCFH